MKKKRSHGEGSISRRPNGTWMAQLTLGRDPVTGKLIRPTRYFRVRREAVEWLQQLAAQAAAGTYLEVSDITLGEWLKRWLDTYAKPSLRPTTFESYDSVVRTHILPNIGTIRLKDLRPEHLQSFYNKKLCENRRDGKPLSPTTVRYLHVVVHRALNQAVKEQLVPRNAADAVNKPRKRRTEIAPLDADQLRIFLAAAESSSLHVAFVVEWATGLRRGELLGLRWQDVDEHRACIHISQSLVRTRLGLSMAEPKTAKSRRAIPVPEQVMEALCQHRAKQAEQKQLAGAAYDDQGLVFANPFGRPLDPRSFTRHFERLLAKAGLPRIRFHDMRHSHATLLLTLGEHSKVVQERLGHSTISMTLDTYSHVLPHLQERVAQKLGGLLEPAQA